MASLKSAKPSNQADWVLRQGAATLVGQIVASIRERIDTGRLKPGDRIQSDRELAAEVGVARGTVRAAYDILAAEGLLETRVGSGTFVTEEAALPKTVNARPDLRPVIEPRNLPQPLVDHCPANMIDFRPCRPSLEFFPQQAWKRCVAVAASALPSADYGEAQGSEALRIQICGYLRRARGLAIEPDEIFITNGTVHAFQLLSALYLDSGSQVLVEDPGYRLAWQTFALSGAKIVGVPVDDDGLAVDRLPSLAGNAKFVYVTPSHQFPTGSRLSLARRHALIEWAHQNRVLILEDDYDGEFRYDVPPLAPLAVLSRECVVYCGTFSKTLFPDLRIGFVVAHKEIIAALSALRTVTEYAPNAIMQSALAAFIKEHHFERHIRKMRKVYAQRRAVLAEALNTECGRFALSGLNSGLHVVVRLSGSQPASDLSAKLAMAGVNAPPISRYSTDNSLPDDRLILGYAALQEASILVGASKLTRL